MSEITVKAGETLVLRSTVTLDLVEGTRTVTNQTWEVIPAPDPQPPSLREQVAEAIRDRTISDGTAFDYLGDADAVLAVVADWLAAQPVVPNCGSAVDGDGCFVKDQRAHDVALIRDGGTR